MECFGTTDFGNNSRLITLSTIIISGLHCIRQNYSSIQLDLYIFGQQTGRQKLLHWIIASIPWLQSALNFFMNRILICLGCSQIFEVFHPFKGFITYIHIYIYIHTHTHTHTHTYTLWLCTACWSRDMTIYLIFLSFSSKPISLLTAASVFSFTVCILAPNIVRSL